MLEYLSEEIADSLRDSVSATASKYCSKDRLVAIKSHLVEECIDLTDRSLQFHQVSFDEMDEYKIAAHFSFWLAELKPMSFDFAGGYKVNENGGRGEVKHLTLLDENDVIVRSEPFLINEVVAYDVAYFTITTHQETYYEANKTQLKPQIIKGFRRFQEENAQKFEYTKDAVVDSLRNNNHTCRTWSLFMECMFKTPTEWLHE